MRTNPVSPNGRPADGQLDAASVQNTQRGRIRIPLFCIAVGIAIVYCSERSIGALFDSSDSQASGFAAIELATETLQSLWGSAVASISGEPSRQVTSAKIESRPQLPAASTSAPSGLTSNTQRTVNSQLATSSQSASVSSSSALANSPGASSRPGLASSSASVAGRAIASKAGTNSGGGNTNGIHIDAVNSFTDVTATGAWNTSRWNNSTDGPTYTATYTANQDVSFTAGAYSFAGMGATINVGNITVASGVTVTFTAAANTFATNGTVRTINVGSGGTFNLASQAISTAAGTGFNKTGAGTLIIGSSGLYPGGFTLTAGTMVAGGVNAMGAGGALNLNGGILTVNSSTLRDFTGKYAGGISIGGDVQFGDSVNVAAGTGGMTFSNNVALGAATRTITIGSSGTYTLGGIISGAAGTGLTVNAIGGATGILALGGANTYTGKTTISAGTLSINTIQNAGSVTGNSLGTPAAGANSIIDLAGTLKYTGSASGSSDRIINLTGAAGGAGSLDASGTATFALSGGVTSAGTSGISTLTLTGSGAGSESGTIANGTSTNVTALTKTGAGTWTLSGGNSYTGLTTVSAGTLAEGASNAIATGDLTVNGATAIFDLGASHSDSVGTVTLDGGGAINGTGTSALTSTGTFEMKSGTVGAILDGSGIALNKTTSGTVTLSGVNTYTGATTISGGTLKVSGSLAAGSAVAINSGGTLSGTGTVNGTVAVNSGGTISPGNSPGTLNTGATTYNSAGNYLWEINQANGTKGTDPGWDWQNITGSLTVASTSGSPFNVNITGLTTGNVSGAVKNFNPANSYTWTIATGSGGISGFAANKFNLDSSAFVNNNAALNGTFGITTSGNDLNLTFTPSGSGNLPQGLGIFANDNAAQSAYTTNGTQTGSNGGFGYGAWTLTNPGGSGAYQGSSSNNDAGGSNFGNINVAGNSWGFFSAGNNLVEASRAITGNLTVGRTFSIDLDNGSLATGNSAGFSLRNASGNNVLEFFGTGGNTNGDSSTFAYTIAGSVNQFTNLKTGSDFTREGMHIEITLTSASTYSLTISGPGLTTQTFTGSLQNPAGGQTISTLRLFDNANGANSDFDWFANSTVITLPTWDGTNHGSGNWSTGSNWAAHVPVNGGSIAFDGGTGAISANNDNLTSVYNIAFNATGNPATGNNTTNATTYTLTGNALTINGGIDNNSTNLQTINNNLTLGANQSFNATNGGLTFGGTLALGGKQLTLNAANAVTYNSSAVISGNGDITKTGSGTLTLNAANTFTGDNTNNRGQVFITDGTVRVGNNAALGTQTGSTSVDLGDSNPISGTLTHFSNNVSLLANSGITLGNQIFVDVNTGGSTRTIGSDGTTGPVTFNGNVLLSSSGGNVVLTAANGGDVTFNGVVGPGIFTNGSVTKSGTGTVILTGNNGYTGGTIVNAGTLLVNNTTGSGTGTGAVIVNNSGTTLGGNGAISGSVTVNSGANLSPGNSPGKLTTGSLTLATNSNFVVDLNGATLGSYDQVSVIGSASIGGSNLVLNINGTLNLGDKFYILLNDNSDANIGTFAQGSSITSGGYTFGINYADFASGFGGDTGSNDISLTLTAVPEPGTWIAGALALAVIGWQLIGFRRWRTRA